MGIAWLIHSPHSLLDGSIYFQVRQFQVSRFQVSRRNLVRDAGIGWVDAEGGG